MPQGKPGGDDLRRQLQDAQVKLNEATTPAERFGAQRRVNAIKRAMAAAGVDAAPARAPAPAPRPRPAAPAPRPAPAPPARRPTAQDAIRERRDAERELGLERGGDDRKIRLRPKRP